MKFKRYLSIVLLLTILIISAVIPSSAATIQMGDVNGDGVINVTDATLIQKKINGNKIKDKYYGQYSDFDYSGRTDIADATLIQKYLAGNMVIYNRYFFTIKGTSASVYKYFGSATELTVPSRLNGYGCDVTKIGKNAFSNNRTLTTVTLPSSVKSIEDSAFNNCSSLKIVYSKNSNLKWGNSFVNCPKFQAIKFI